MARKGWDALSEAYRKRLIKSGVSQSAYETGAPLHSARGHTSTAREAFNRRTRMFVKQFGVPADSPDFDISRIRALGPVRGQAYMDYRRRMTRAYERGDYREAERMYVRRPARHLPDHMWWYHGMFGG